MPLIETDALIVGAGPAGIFQAFQLGLQGVHVHLIDALPHAGGQCVELYADKPIYDIPGIVRCSGQELTDSLLKQVAPFKPTFHWQQLVSEALPSPDGRWSVQTSAGQRFVTKTLFIAAGVGAFQPRTLKVEGLEAFAGKQFHYVLPEPRLLAGKNVLIVGDTESALQTALQLASLGDGAPAFVTVMHRREVFSAEPETVAAFKDAVRRGALHFVAAQMTGVETSLSSDDASVLTAAQVLNAEGQNVSLPVDQIISLQGLSPKLGPIADWGLAMERRQLTVDTATFETSQPGIYAVGDINTYPGKKKLILCAFHECVLAAFAAMTIIAPEKKILLQYTTTSTHLHALLGV